MVPRNWLPFGALLLALALRGLPLPATASTNHHVILITIDGLAGFYLSDEQAPIPTLRRLAKEGAVAEGLRVSNPAVTWPNHTSLITGVHPEKHSVLFNGVLIRPGPGEPVRIESDRDQSELVAVPTLYDYMHHAGYRTAGINWPGTRGAKTLDDNFPDVPNPIRHTTPRLRAQLIGLGLLRDTEDESFLANSAAARDQIWTAAAVHLIQTRRPSLLLLHLLITDTVQHRHGPQTLAAYTALALADAHVDDIVRAVEAAGLRERTTIVVASDHGFVRPHKLVNPNVVFRKAGLQRPGPRRRAQAMSHGGTAFVYLTAPETREADRARVIELLREHEGIADILEPDKFAALHLPEPEHNPQMGDLLLVAKEGYAFSNESFEDDSLTEITFPVGSHGYLATNPNMNGVFVAWGRGIKPGPKLGVVEIIDVAPTIAGLLGQKLPHADGRIIRALLKEPLPR
ncbi:MAG: alkaline phosphatase family protein [Verrucomicrobiae bacterium]|nr:alkaline phosphatase family protein [Verrucomicrobiae bacterium]